jgi:N-acetylmuramoyl-L-alanine amidase
VGPETYRALDEARWRLGDRLLSHAVRHPFVGDDVAELQRRLLDMGFDPGRCDGIFGWRTDAALREFQRNVGLLPDGTCGPATLAALTRLARTVVGGRPDLIREAELLHRAGPTLGGKVIVLDPGHGGAESGSAVDSLTEAEIVLDIAQRIEGRLAAGGMRVFLTRGADGNPTDAERADFANTVGADLFLSLHVDQAPGQQDASGVTTYYYGGNLLGSTGIGSPVGERFAELVQGEVVGRTELLDCRSHGRTWELLRRTRMPAVRLELGYLTCPRDAARLATPSFRDTVAEAVHAAVTRLYAGSRSGVAVPALSAQG